MELENIMLSEISQTLNVVKFHLYKVPRVVKFRESRTLIIRGLGELRNGKLLFNVYFQFGMMKKFLRWIVEIAAQQCECS